MRITSIRLSNFKRFKDLTIDSIPKEAKLVLLIGSNGSGKTSIFDAFSYFYTLTNKVKQFKYDKDYYCKNGAQPNVEIRFADHSTLSSLNINREKLQHKQAIIKKFIGRSSIRIVPKITSRGIPELVLNNEDAPETFIDTDTRFDNDLTAYIRQIDDALRTPVFRGQAADTLKIFNGFLEPLNQSLIRILGNNPSITIQLAEYESATSQNHEKLIFKKGDSKINYDLLSHGEKQIVILLLNFIIRKEQYKDAIIYIDELDCHLNTSLQSRLISEIVNHWVPDSSQLWTASHALGFIDFARQADNAAIIDLNSLDFDDPQTVLPQRKESLEIYDIAVPKEIAGRILKGHKLVAVENTNDQYFNAALGEKGYLFLPAANNREVFLMAKGDSTILGLRDRDYLKPEEIEKITKKYPNLKVLNYYAFENLIYHPDNLEEIGYKKTSKSQYIEDIIGQKNAHLIDIAAEIGTSRQTYVEFKEGLKDDHNIAPIIEALKSDDFETFYPYYNIKKYYSKSLLQPYLIKELVQTSWFRQTLEEILAQSAS